MQSQSGTHSTRSTDTELAVQVETASSEVSVVLKIGNLGRIWIVSRSTHLAGASSSLASNLSIFLLLVRR